MLEEKINKNLHMYVSFWLILGGAIWNWIERVFIGNVVDFIWVKYFSVFNVADSFITLGAILYMVVLFLDRKKLS